MVRIINKNIIILLLGALFFLNIQSSAQFKNKWMNVGSLHSWYSEIGCELEAAGFVQTQQDGLQWPAIYPYQDMQAAKGMWIGAKNFTDENGNVFPAKVVTIGPRNPAFWAAYPIEFKTIAKYPPTEVYVDGNLSYEKEPDINEYNPNLKFDRVIVNVVNTQLGLTMTRKIMQTSQQYHDNYIIYEYTFTNTGNTDADDEIELPNQTLNDVMIYFTYRYAVNKATRYVIGNSTGWGKNTMNDTRGDGVKVDPPNENFRAQYAWHGYHSEKIVPYDNIGGPIWQLDAVAARYNNPADTVGRLGATQFVGNVTLHADKSAVDNSDDPAQPSTTTYEDSDNQLFLAGANAFNTDRMNQEYNMMTKGHMSPRHADKVMGDDLGEYWKQRTDPNLGNSGGFSNNNGYGPYTLAFGDSIKIVIAEGAAGISRKLQLETGIQYKNNQISDEDKNKVVLQGRDSLFQTFRRAIENYKAGYSFPEPPRPPKSFNVNSGGDRISLSWVVDDTDPNPPVGFKIYRAEGDRDADYDLVAELGADARSYDDTSPIRGFKYYYYIVAVGADQSGDNTTPAGQLISGRYYTQTYDPAQLQRQAGTSLSQIRIVPNPFNISAAQSVRFPGESDRDKIAFYNIPGQCTIKIYTELGELIKTIEHTDGSGDEFWYSVTSSNQIVVSGLYIAVITNTLTGESQIAKFAVIR